MIKKLLQFPEEGLNASIVLTRTPTGYHIGIIHKNRDTNTCHILHLAWHRQLYNDDLFEALNNTPVWETGHFITPVNFPVELQIQLAAVCRRIFERQKESTTPYGFFYDGKTYFSKEFELILGQGCSGLTCATFVMATFTHIGVKLLDVFKWAKRVSDGEWHKQMLTELEKTCQDVEHIQKIKAEVGCARFRPNEVAAGLRFENKPASMDEIVKVGNEIDELMPKLAPKNS